MRRRPRAREEHGDAAGRVSRPVARGTSLDADPPPRPGAPGRRTVEVLLAWARDREGRKVHVGALDRKAREARAPFTCLGCGEELTPRLGKIRARHFAHRPGSTCPLTAPETALHLDAKERLLALAADAFAGRRRVSILSRCPTCRRLVPRDLAAVGDEACAEGSVGPLRADVLILAGGRPALAVEVKVTHAVEAEKEAALAAASLPAVEVDAREEWEREEADTTAIACVRSLGFPPCPRCAAQARAEEDRARGGEAAEIAELEAYRARGLLGMATPPPSPLPALRARGGGEGKRDLPATPTAPTISTPTSTSTATEAPLTRAELDDLALRFRCPDCSSAALIAGERLVRHACPGRAPRPVAWRGYDGSLVKLSWWRAAAR